MHLTEEINRKIKVNALKYPAEQVKGSCKEDTEYSINNIKVNE